MSEYIIRWNGIGAQLTDMLNSYVPPYLWAKRIREERRLERIVRCRDCAYYDGEPDLESSMPKCWRDPEHRGAAVWTRPDGFCAWGERKKVDE